MMLMNGTHNDEQQCCSDDEAGQRVRVHGAPSTTCIGSNANANERGSTPLEYFYEIDRLTSEISTRLGLLGPGDGGGSGGDERENARNGARKAGRADKIECSPRACTSNNGGFLCRIALQFPDELLADAAQVSHLLERSLTDLVATHTNDSIAATSSAMPSFNSEAPAPVPASAILPPLIFVLGDTTYGACCPDEIGAQHLNADILVHFGTRACLGPTETLPVVYSFGRKGASVRGPGGGLESGSSDADDINEKVNKCVDLVISEVSKACEANDAKKKHGVDVAIDGSDDKSNDPSLLILYGVQHWHLAKAVTNRLVDRNQMKAICGRIPDYPSGGRDEGERSRTHDCSSSLTTWCKSISDEGPSNGDTGVDLLTAAGANSDEFSDLPTVIGGLVVPSNIRLSDYTLLYIGDASGKKDGSRQFLNILLRLCSPGGTNGCWAYDPHKPEAIDTDPESSIRISRYLNRRYYLIQKTKMASIIGILVGTLSQKRFRSVINRVRLLVEESGRSCYTFAVGKINVAKLANYAEIEAFVLIGCTESSVLDDEREFHVPIVTPMELEVALGEREWNGFYSHEFSDFLSVSDNNGADDGNGGCHGESKLSTDPPGGDFDGVESDGDEPFFSPISGKYESVGGKIAQKYTNKIDLLSLPVGGQMTEYKSGAAEFWQEREYKGMEAAVGASKVKAAVQGQTGIASDYGEVLGTVRGAREDDDFNQIS
jgi:diphthamide biosynthesis protein 2